LKLMVWLDGFVFLGSSLSRGPAAALTDEVPLLSAETRDAVQSAVLGSRRQTNDYDARQRVRVPAFLRLRCTA
jgi:hypothetical protein